MAGPSFIHYNTTTDIVSGVYTTSRTPLGGEAEVNETHPLFFPPVTSQQWQRTGVNTYVLQTEMSFPDDQILNGISSSTDHALVRWDGSTGDLIQDSDAILLDNGKSSFSNDMRVGAAFASPYRFSVQRNSSTESYIEILNSAGAGKGAFFGLELNLTNQDFALYNWQGGPITFSTDTTASSGVIRLIIREDGDVEVKNLTLGIVKSDAVGTLSSGAVIDLLTDVDTTTSAPSLNDVLVWDNSNWVPQAPGAGTDELIKVTANDTTAGFLFAKLIGTTNKITVTEVNDGGDEDLQINIGGDIFDTSVDDTDDITEGSTNLFYTEERVDDRVAALIVGGTNITITYGDSAGALTIDGDVVSIDDLSDVDTTTSAPVLGEVLTWDNTNWVPGTGTGAGGFSDILAGGDWVLDSGTTYVGTVTHSLGTDDITVLIYDTGTLLEVGVEDLEIVDTNTVKVYVEGNAESLKVNVVSGSGPTGPTGPAGSGMLTGISKNSGANVNAAARSVLNFIEGTGITLTIADDAGGDEVDVTIDSTGGFGTEFLSTEALTEAQTTSTTPVQRLTLNPTGMTAGFTYMVTWSYTWRYTSTGNDFMSQIDQDNGTFLWLHDQATNDTATTQRTPASGFAMVTGLSGSHTFDLDFWSENAAETAFIYFARLAFWRVS